MSPKPEPITTAPGQTYGDQAEQARAQRAIPMGPQPVGVPSSPDGGNAAGGGPQEMIAALQAHAAGGGGPHPDGFMRPTENPDEHVTHGINAGPGAGPDALTGVGAAAVSGAMGQATLSQLLSSLASQPFAPSAVQDLANRAQAGFQ